MRNLFYTVAVGAMSLSGSANALTLLGATVTGPSGTVWRTSGSSIGNTSNYALFLASPTQSSFVNPANQPISQNVAVGKTKFFLSGDGFPTNGTGNSDRTYTLTLDFDGGRKLTGSYTPFANAFLGGNSIQDGRNVISIAKFSFVRFLGDSVSQFSATPGGNGNDYNGNFELSSVAGAVPEPGSWALMIGGFGLIGLATRRRHRIAVQAQ
ncbi:MAG TPA: PEPxxWA-CTERM sorting domain-containing protein [Sphingomonas sp.]|nr:PEPxxWA-CTERM sorting domain-containing protein [Sphingomonas sp.]